MEFLYGNVLSDSTFSKTLYPQTNGSLFGSDYCDRDDDVCWTHLMKGPNLENMLLRLTIQSAKLIFNMFGSDSVGMEISSGSFYCINIDIANESTLTPGVSDR